MTKITAFVKEICLLGVVCKVLNKKTCNIERLITNVLRKDEQKII